LTCADFSATLLKARRKSVADYPAETYEQRYYNFISSSHACDFGAGNHGVFRKQIQEKINAFSHRRHNE
jgi:hypothetical protein